MEQSLPHTLCSELLLIATCFRLSSSFAGTSSGDLLVRCNRSSYCKYCDTRSPPPNSRGHRRRMLHLPSRDIETAWLRYLHPTRSFLSHGRKWCRRIFRAYFCGWPVSSHRTRRTPGPPTSQQSCPSPFSQRVGACRGRREAATANRGRSQSTNEKRSHANPS